MGSWVAVGMDGIEGGADGIVGGAGGKSTLDRRDHTLIQRAWKRPRDSLGPLATGLPLLQISNTTLLVTRLPTQGFWTSQQPL